MEPEKRIQQLVGKRIVQVFRDASDVYICCFPVHKELHLYSKEFRKAFKAFWYREFAEQLHDYQLNNIIGFLEDRKSVV